MHAYLHPLASLPLIWSVELNHYHRTKLHARTHTHTRTHTYREMKRVNIQKARTHARTQTHTLTLTHACTNTPASSRSQAYTHAHTHTHALVSSPPSHRCFLVASLPFCFSALPRSQRRRTRSRITIHEEVRLHAESQMMLIPESQVMIEKSCLGYCAYLPLFIFLSPSLLSNLFLNFHPLIPICSSIPSRPGASVPSHSQSQIPTTALYRLSIELMESARTRT